MSPETDMVESLSTVKGLAQLGTGIAITVIVCYVIVNHLLPFVERCLDKVLTRHKETIDIVVASYDKFLVKISDNLEKSLSNVSNDIRELRAELRDELRDRKKE